MRKHHMKLRVRKLLKRRDKVTLYLFVIGLLVLFILGMSIPLRPKVSDVEKRELERFPQFQLNTFLSGEYFSQITLWYADTFPFRETLLSANSKVKELYGVKTQQLYGAIAEADEIPEAGNPPAAAETFPEQQEDEDAEPVKETLAERQTETMDSSISDVAAEAAQMAAEAGQEKLPDATIHTEPEVAGTVYIADGKGFELYYFNREGADLYAAAINDAAKKLSGTAQVYNMLVPTAVSVCLDEKIQENLKSSPQNKVFDYVYGQIDSSVKKVPVFDTLKKHNAEYIYYNTDHHWTALGAYYGYLEFAKAKGFEPKGLEEYETRVFDHFVGSFYSFSNQSEVLKNNADTITAYVPKGTNVIRYIEKDGGEKKWNIINDVSDYAPGVKYSCFIGGDNPFSWINNPDITDGSSCVVIKESYGNAFVPFLVDHYQMVYVVDYRYYEDNLIDFVKENKVQDVIFLNNADALTKRLSTLLGGILK